MGIELAMLGLQVRPPNHYATRPWAILEKKFPGSVLPASKVTQKYGVINGDTIRVPMAANNHLCHLGLDRSAALSEPLSSEVAIGSNPALSLASPFAARRSPLAAAARRSPPPLEAAFEAAQNTAHQGTAQ